MPKLINKTQKVSCQPLSGDLSSCCPLGGLMCSVTCSAFQPPSKCSSSLHSHRAALFCAQEQAIRLLSATQRPRNGLLSALACRQSLVTPSQGVAPSPCSASLLTPDLRSHSPAAAAAAAAAAAPSRYLQRRPLAAHLRCQRTWWLARSSCMWQQWDQMGSS
jgi:hypothetical protein